MESGKWRMGRAVVVGKMESREWGERLGLVMSLGEMDLISQSMR